MVVEVAGIQIQEAHAAAAGLVALALVLGLFLMPGKKPAGKKKGDSEKKKKAPVSREKKQASKPKVKEEPKPKVEEKKAEPEAPQEVAAKVGKKAKARAVEEAAKADANDGWTVSVDKNAKKKKERLEAEKAKAPVFASGKPIPGMADEPAGKKKKGKEAAAAVANQGVAVDYRKAAAEDEQRPQEQKAEDPKEKIPLPKEKIGILVGPKGAMINLLKEKTGVTGIDTQGGFVTISGPPPAVALCCKQVKDLLSKGYCELQFENFAEVFVKAYPASFPELIGQKGAVVRQLKEQLGVEIQFPQTEPKGFGKGLPQKELKIAVAGPKDKVAEAKAAMTEILENHHSELTHPGEIHEEVEVESWLYSFIIGTRGSELKHIQQNFKVRVFIPRGEYEAPVLVVGLPANVERAVKYIKKVVEQAKNRPTGSGRGGDAGYADMDQEGDDHEPWMDEFMYKRK